MSRTLATGPTTRLSLALGVALVASPAQADSGRSFVVATGGDSSLYVSEDTSDRASLGYFGRLSWETPVPEYTDRAKGYRWNFGLDPDVEFSRGWGADGERLTLVEAGLRLNIPFSQRRMGLLEVSARGGFWLALRGGVSNIDAQSSRVGLGFPDGEAPQGGGLMSPLRRDSSMLLDIALGEFILLGRSGLRWEFEFSTLMSENADTLGGSSFGIRARTGIGAYF